MLPAGSVQGQQQAANGMTEADMPWVEDSVGCGGWISQLQTEVGGGERDSLVLVWAWLCWNNSITARRSGFFRIGVAAIDFEDDPEVAVGGEVRLPWSR